MFESRITVSRTQMEQLWLGYMCAACLEDVHELGPFPAVCPLCGFSIRLEQRRRLEEDFAGEVEAMRRDGWIEREQALLEEKFHKPKTQIHVRRDP